ncbi:transposase domain-containing protein [Lactiplantibacillus nangangensis]|uniref:Transposase domain-containing protein n=1 Tax=Lactiplantibacillus nangangensis TaxID=2559917 RepID=A0ABW1SIU2_9LACO|nr:transposase domain-containing protein [Lactiplantibacillus nangangensis]
MTLIESAKANGIDPSAYLKCLLKNIPQLPTFCESGRSRSLFAMEL